MELADALPRRGTARLQLELFDLAEVEAPAKRRARLTAKRVGAAPIPCPGELEDAKVGVRHQVLFWHARHAVYKEPRGASYEAWERRVRLIVGGMQIGMPSPRLPGREIERMAHDIASWVWSRPPVDRSWAAQFRRGVKREYGSVTRRTVEALWERNRAILAAVEGGAALLATSRRFGVHRKLVQRTVAAAETWLSPDAKRETLDGIWGPHNPPRTESKPGVRQPIGC